MNRSRVRVVGSLKRPGPSLWRNRMGTATASHDTEPPQATAAQANATFKMKGPITTEVQFLSFVCSTGGKGSKPRLWNRQNLGAVLYLRRLHLPRERGAKYTDLSINSYRSCNCDCNHCYRFGSHDG